MNQPFNLDRLGPGSQSVRQAIEDMPPHDKKRLHVARIAAAVGLPTQEGNSVDQSNESNVADTVDSPPGYSVVEVQEALRACMLAHPPEPPAYVQHPDAAEIAHLFATMLNQGDQFVPAHALSDKLRSLLAALVHEGKPQPMSAAHLVKAKGSQDGHHG